MCDDINNKLNAFRDSLRREMEESRKADREEMINILRGLLPPTTPENSHTRIRLQPNSSSSSISKPSISSILSVPPNKPIIILPKISTNSLPNMEFGPSTSKNSCQKTTVIDNPNPTTNNNNSISTFDNPNNYQNLPPKNYNSVPNINNNITKIKLDNYDGSISWTRHKIHFNIVAENNGWSMREKASQLASSLRGKAQAILENVSLDDLKNFNKISELLNNKFNETKFARMFYNQLQTRQQKSDENLSQFADEIERLTHLAHSDMSIESRDKIACQQFINGLSNLRTERSLRSETIECLHEAVERATELESLDELIDDKKKRRKYNSENNNNYKNRSEKNNRNFNSNKKRTEVTCFKCGTIGHYANKCSNGN